MSVPAEEDALLRPRKLDENEISDAVDAWRDDSKKKSQVQVINYLEDFLDKKVVLSRPIASQLAVVGGTILARHLETNGPKKTLRLLGQAGTKEEEEETPVECHSPKLVEVLGQYIVAGTSSTDIISHIVFSVFEILTEFERKSRSPEGVTVSHQALPVPSEGKSKISEFSDGGVIRESRRQIKIDENQDKNRRYVDVIKGPKKVEKTAKTAPTLGGAAKPKVVQSPKELVDHIKSTEDKLGSEKQPGSQETANSPEQNEPLKPTEAGSGQEPEWQEVSRKKRKRSKKTSKGSQEMNGSAVSPVPDQKSVSHTGEDPQPSKATQVPVEEMVLSIGAMRGEYPLVCIHRPGMPVEYVQVLKVDNRQIDGQLIGKKTPVNVSIFARGLNFGRDKEGRNIQYQYTVRVMGKSLRCVSRLPVLTALRKRIRGEVAMKELRRDIIADYARLVERYGPPSQNSWE